jgi:hypothetical protein
MKRMLWMSGLFVGVVTLAGNTRPALGHVSIGIHVTPPPIVLSAPPELVVVPGSPVFYAPGVPYNYFFHGGATIPTTAARGSMRRTTAVPGSMCRWGTFPVL